MKKDHISKNPYQLTDYHYKVNSVCNLRESLCFLNSRNLDFHKLFYSFMEGF